MFLLVLHDLVYVSIHVPRDTCSHAFVLIEPGCTVVSLKSRHIGFAL